MTELKYIRVDILDDVDGIPIIEVIQFLTEFIEENLTEADQIDSTTINIGASDDRPEVTIEYSRPKTAADIEEEEGRRQRRNKAELDRAEKHYLRLKKENKA